MVRDYLTLRGNNASRAAALATGQAAMYRLIAENTVDVIIRYDAEGRRLYVSPSVRDMMGYDPDSMLGKHALDLLHPDDIAGARVVLRKMGTAHPSALNVFRARRQDGVYLWIEGRYRYLAEDGGHVAVLRDITASKRAEEMLADLNGRLTAANLVLQGLAQQDGLTGLANRRRFDEMLALEFSRARREALPLGLVLLDVDCFKLYNDRYGHLAGDDCLRRVSATIASILSRPADIAARYGGEEVVALLPSTDAAGAMMMAERMRHAVQALGIAHIASPLGIVTVSAGVGALTPADGVTDAVDLIAAADLALYQAKAAGRNQVCGGGTGGTLPAATAAMRAVPGGDRGRAVNFAFGAPVSESVATRKA